MAPGTVGVHADSAGPDPGLFNRGFKISDEGLDVDLTKLPYLLTLCIRKDMPQQTV